MARLLTRPVAWDGSAAGGATRPPRSAPAIAGDRFARQVVKTAGPVLSVRLPCRSSKIERLRTDQPWHRSDRACAATRAQDAAVQVVPIRTAFSQHPFRRPQHLQPSTTSRLSVRASDLQSRSSRPVARCGCRRKKTGFDLTNSLNPVRYRDNAGSLPNSLNSRILDADNPWRGRSKCLSTC